MTTTTINIENSTLKLLNGGNGLFHVTKNRMFHQITHISKYAQTTDAILDQTDTQIAHFVKNNTNPLDVEATLLGQVTRLVHEILLRHETMPVVNKKMPPLFVRADGSYYQVAGIFYTVETANEFMAANKGTSLIDTIDATLDETYEMYIIASDEPSELVAI